MHEKHGLTSTSSAPAPAPSSSAEALPPPPAPSSSSPPRFAGWWGHRLSDRFDMGPDFHPSEGTSGTTIRYHHSTLTLRYAISPHPTSTPALPYPNVTPPLLFILSKVPMDFVFRIPLCCWLQVTPPPSHAFPSPFYTLSSSCNIYLDPNPNPPLTLLLKILYSLYNTYPNHNCACIV